MSQNPYQSTQPAWSTVSVADASVDARAAFIRNTYLHLTGAFIAFAAICGIAITLFDEQIGQFTATVTQGYMWLIFLGGFMFVSYIANNWAHNNTSRGMQYAGLCVYVVAESILFLPLLYMASHFSDPSVIPAAGVITLVVFGGLSAVVFMTKADFSFMRYALYVGGFAAIGLIIASIFMGFSLGIWFSVAMVVYAAGSILYNTSNVMHHYNPNQHVAASLALFSSVALMLWYVIQILMSLDE